MFALSRDGEKVFLHQPDTGMAVPVLVDLERGSMTVRVPSIDELENDYAVYDDLKEVLAAAGRGHREQIYLARKFSQKYSKEFREQLLAANLTVSALRKLVERHLRQVEAAGTCASAPAEAVFAGAFSED